MIAKEYKDFLIRLEELGLNMYLRHPKGGWVDVVTDDIEKWLDDEKAFWEEFDKG